MDKELKRQLSTIELIASENFVYEAIMEAQGSILTNKYAEGYSIVPGCFYFLGVRNEEKGIVHEWHHPKFDIDERALPIGAGILAQSALEFLNKAI